MGQRWHCRDALPGVPQAPFSRADVANHRAAGMKITRTQAEALATLATKLRPDWRHAGVMAAIAKCPDADPFDIARALVNLAADPTVQTPGLLHRGGPHWLRPDGEKPARRGDHAVRCPEHPDQTQPCQPCKADATPMPDEVRAALADAIAKGQAAIPHTRREPLRPKAALDPKETRR